MPLMLLYSTDNHVLYYRCARDRNNVLSPVMLIPTLALCASASLRTVSCGLRL